MKTHHRNRCDEILALIDRCLAECDPGRRPPLTYGTSRHRSSNDMTTSTAAPACSGPPTAAAPPARPTASIASGDGSRRIFRLELHAGIGTVEVVRAAS